MSNNRLVKSSACLLDKWQINQKNDCINTESQFPRLTRLTYLMCGFSSNDFMADVGDRKFKRQKTPMEIAAEYADSLYEPEQWSRWENIITY